MVWLNIISSLDDSFFFMFYSFKVSSTVPHLYCNDLWVLCLFLKSGEVCNPSGLPACLQKVSLRALVDRMKWEFGRLRRLEVHESASGGESWHLDTAYVWRRSRSLGGHPDSTEACMYERNHLLERVCMHIGSVCIVCLGFFTVRERVFLLGGAWIDRCVCSGFFAVKFSSLIWLADSKAHHTWQQKSIYLCRK